MSNTRKLTGRYIGALTGAVAMLVFWLTTHSPYNIYKAIVISLLPLVFGFIGGYIEQKWFQKRGE